MYSTYCTYLCHFVSYFVFVYLCILRQLASKVKRFHSISHSSMQKVKLIHSYSATLHCVQTCQTLYLTVPDWIVEKVLSQHLFGQFLTSKILDNMALCIELCTLWRYCKHLLCRRVYVLGKCVAMSSFC